MEVKKGKVCFLCDGTGKYKKPIDETKYDKQFDKYAEFLSMGEARRKALLFALIAAGQEKERRL